MGGRTMTGPNLQTPEYLRKITWRQNLDQVGLEFSSQNSFHIDIRTIYKNFQILITFHDFIYFENFSVTKE